MVVKMIRGSNIAACLNNIIKDVINSQVVELI
jgi:hypothetical protein